MQILSENTKTFLKKSCTHVLGTAIFAYGLMTMISIFFYNPSNLSFNTSGDAKTNLLSNIGSYHADILLQGLGVGGILLSFTLMAWGYRLARYGILRRPLLRGILLFISIIFIITSLATFGVPLTQTSPVEGILGMFIYNNIVQHLNEYTPILCSVLALTGVLLFLYAVAIEKEEWQFTFAKIKNTTITLSYALVKHTFAIYNFIKNKSNNVVGNSTSSTGQSSQLDKHKQAQNQQDYTPTPAPLFDDTQSMDMQSKAKPKPRPRSRVKNSNDEFELPPSSLLQSHKAKSSKGSSVEERNANAQNLVRILKEFGVSGTIENSASGPVVTTYELELDAGVRTSRVVSLTDDIARTMGAKSVRIAPIPGKTYIGIEMPNNKPDIVEYKGLIESKTFSSNEMRLPIILGKTINGGEKIADLAAMPHLMIAGTTGSGKSVGLNSMILSLLFKYTPEQLRLIMVDPKMLEFSMYEDIPHLLTPVVTDPKKAIVALKWATNEMNDRYKNMSKVSVRNIEGYNTKMEEYRRNGEVVTDTIQLGFDEKGAPIFEEKERDLSSLPYIVIIIDEMADLMLMAGKEIEIYLQSLAQKARAAGIHLIMATQRPSVDVITGTIKANFPTRISYMVTSKIDSRTILGEQGAEQLLGRGDMLVSESGGILTRNHAPFVQDAEVQAVTDWLRAQKTPDYVDGVTDENENEGGFEAEILAQANGGKSSTGASKEDMYDKAIELVTTTQKASVSFIQRSLKIGYNRAANIVEQMEAEGIVSAANHVGKRNVLAPKREY